MASFLLKALAIGGTSLSSDVKTAKNRDNGQEEEEVLDEFVRARRISVGCSHPYAGSVDHS